MVSHSPEPREPRTRICQAAFRLFGKQGYARTSIQEIADAAVVKKPVLYYYFESKEALYRALLGQSLQILRQAIRETLAGLDERTSCEEQLGHFAEAILRLARENQDPVRFFFAHVFAADEDRPACPLEDFEMQPRAVFARLASEGIRREEIRGSIEDLERLVLGAIQACVIHHLRHPDEEPLSEGLGRRIVRSALDGFRPAGASRSES